jgi:hypothetical protein
MYSSVLDATAESAVCLLRKILQEQGVHRTLESDVQVRDVALGVGDDAHAGEGEALEEIRSVFLVAAEAVQRLGEHDVEPPIQRVAHQRPESGAKQRGAGDRMIGEILHDRSRLVDQTTAGTRGTTAPEAVVPPPCLRISGVEAFAKVWIPSGCR